MSKVSYSLINFSTIGDKLQRLITLLRLGGVDLYKFAQ